MGEIWGCGWPPGVTGTAEQTQDLGVKSELLGPHEDFLETVMEKASFLSCPASFVPS